MKQYIVLVLLVASLSTVSALDPWEPLGPEGITVAAMTAVPGYPDDIFVVPDGYPALLHYSSNAGSSWDVRDTIWDCIDALAVDPNQTQTLYAGGLSGDVYRSTDAGRSWHVRGSLPAGWHVRGLLVNAGNGSNLMAVADASDDAIRVYVSSNGGQQWYESLPLSGFEACALLLDADCVRPDRVAAGGTADNQPVLFVSDDFGSSWSDASDGLEGTAAYGAAFSPEDSAVLLCATDTGVFRSTDGGTSWSQRLSKPAYSVAFAPTSPYYAYAGSDNLVYYSDNEGLFWDAESTGFLGTNTRWLAVNPDQGLELYAGNGVGVFHTFNGGFTWTGVTVSLDRVTVPFLYFSPDSVPVAYTVPPGYAILASTDQGLTWAREFESLPSAGFVTGLAVNPAEPDTVVFVTALDRFLHVTIDRGDSWETYEIDDHFVARGVAYHPLDADTLYAWGGVRDTDSSPARFAVYKSDSAGLEWDDILTRGDAGCCRGFSTSADAETLYAWGEVDGGPAVYRSTDWGGSWVLKDDGLAGAPVLDVARSPADPEVFFCATPAGAFQTYSSMATWFDIGLDGATCLLPDTGNRNGVWVGTDTAANHYTTDGGLFWTATPSAWRAGRSRCSSTRPATRPEPTAAPGARASTIAASSASPSRAGPAQRVARSRLRPHRRATA